MNLSGNVFAWITETLASSPARFVAISLAYNTGALAGGAYPMLASWLAGHGGLPVAPVLPIIGLGLLTLAVLYPGLAESRRAAAHAAAPSRVEMV